MVLSEDALRRALAEAGCSAPVRFDEVTGSTNDIALAMAEAGTPEWTLVGAAHQTAGRGRLGRAWVDHPGESLMFSLVLRPEGLGPERGGLLPLLAGVAAVRASREVGAAACRCKWPNDLLVGSGKAGGILAESSVEAGRIRHVVLGIGINLGPSPPEIPEAASLGEIEADRLLAAFLRAFRDRYEPAHPAFPEAVRSAYRAVSETLDRAVRVTTVDGRTVEGRAVDVDATGALILETPGGRVVVPSGDVIHLGS